MKKEGRRTVANKKFHLSRAIALALLFPLVGTTVNSNLLMGLQQPPEEQKLAEALAILGNAELRENDPERVVRAIQELGELRNPAAIGALVKILTFRRWAAWEKDPNKPVDLSMPRSRGMIYPAVNALKEIGPPSLPALIKVIESHEPNTLETENAMEVIIDLSRYERSAYVQKLKDATESAATPEAAARLRKAAETLKNSKR